MTAARRSHHDTADSAVATVFNRPCTIPTRRDCSWVCCQSVAPVAAAPRLPMIPTPSASLDASRMAALRPGSTLAASSATAVATAPVGTAVSAGCSG